jgi:hypothetical protein
LKVCLKTIKDVAKKNDSILEMLFHEQVAIPLFIDGDREEFLKEWLNDSSRQENYYLDCCTDDFKTFMSNNYAGDDFQHMLSVLPNKRFRVGVYSELNGGLFGSKSASL